MGQFYYTVLDIALTEAETQIPEHSLLSFSSVFPLALLFMLITLCIVFKKKVKAISKRNKETEEMEEKLSFLANIVHELRTPLLLIYSPVKELLRKMDLDNKDYERIKGIYNQVNKMTSMINLILDGSRNKIRREDLVPETIELNTWINSILADYDILCSSDGHRIIFRPDPKIHSTVIDRNIIETGLSNLLNNAVKYSPRGSDITVVTKKTGNQVSITVKDKGRGFCCDAEELFQKHFREKTDDSVPGYGLGLTYVRSLMELAEGTVTASHNDDGIGSSFCLTFPIRFHK
ncbi:MAG: HAMP domain-containing histidine kinase [Bacteroidaceae bacterium]|nr:HAMP domain-containing histidine kinase [Bacteroidaceae bacterium]